MYKSLMFTAALGVVTLSLGAGTVSASTAAPPRSCTHNG